MPRYAENYDDDEDDIKCPVQSSIQTSSSDIDYENVQRVFIERKEQFVNEIFPDFFMKSLKFYHLFTDDDLNAFNVDCRQYLQDYKHADSRENAYKSINNWLFKKLLGKFQQNTNFVEPFLKALRHNDWYLTLADYFEEDFFPKNFETPSNRTITTATTFVPNKLIFNVPEPLSYYLKRESVISKVKDNLIELSKLAGKGMTSFLVLHGISGSGKTVLAASSVREYCHLFPDGVFWLQFEENKETNDVNLIKLKLDELFAWVNLQYKSKRQMPENFKFENFSHFYLLSHFQDHPRSLIVLDDVYSPDVLKHFQFKIPVLVTSQRRDVASREFKNLLFVSMEYKNTGNILSLDESLWLLNKYLPCPIDDEKKNIIAVIEKIFQSINFLPYCIPLIAEQMETFYSEMLMSEQSHSKESIDLCDKWCQLYNLVCKNSNIKLEEKLKNLMQESIGRLDKTRKKHLYDFVIFFDAAPRKVFELIWDTCEVETNSHLENLCSKSLVMKSSNHYGIHNITLKFLLLKLDKEDIKKRHNQLIDSYLKHCEKSLRKDSANSPKRYDFSLLPKEKYIYQFLSNHISSAERFELFPLIFLDLNFISQMINCVGKSFLLNDYQQFQDYFQNDLDKFNNFKNFISAQNFDHEIDMDFRQIALCQPYSGLVTEEAISLISDEQNKNYYFQFCNKNKEFKANNLTRFNNKLETNFATFSPDDRFIALVGNNFVKVLDSRTGLEIANGKVMGGINHCVFKKESENLYFILTSGQHNSVVLWKFDLSLISLNNNDNNKENQYYRKSSLHSYQLVRHRFFHSNKSSKFKLDSESNTTSQSFQCADISCKNEFVVCGDNKGVLYFWSVSTSTLHSLKHCGTYESQVDCLSLSPQSNFCLAVTHGDLHIYSCHYSQKESNEAILVCSLGNLTTKNTIHNAVFDQMYCDVDRFIVFASSGESILEFKKDNISQFDKGDQLKNIPSKPCICGQDWYISLCAVSRNRKWIAGLDARKKNVLLWKLGSSELVSNFRLQFSGKSLDFSADEKSLLVCDERGNLSIFKIDELSIANFQENLEYFSVYYDDNIALSTDHRLNILSIDVKKSLRLFRGFYGQEDKSFSEYLKRKVFVSNSTQGGDRFAVIACDISAHGCVFATQSSVFFCDHSQTTLAKKDFEICSEKILSIQFVPNSSEHCNSVEVLFVVLWARHMALFSVEIGDTSKPAIIQTRFSQSLDLRNDNDCMIITKQEYFDKIHFVSNTLWFLTTNNGHLFEFSHSPMMLCYKASFNEKVSSIDSCVCDQESFVVFSLCAKKIAIYRITNDQLEKIDINSIIRCCRLCSIYMVLGSDKGHIMKCTLHNEHSFRSTLKVDWQRQAYDDFVYDLAISPDKKWIISASNSIKLWNHNGDHLQTFNTHGTVFRLFVKFFPVPDLVDSPNGVHLDLDHKIIAQPTGLEYLLVTLCDANWFYILKNFEKS